MKLTLALTVLSLTLATGTPTVMAKEKKEKSQWSETQSEQKGKGHKKSLPPGLQKRAAMGKPLPPGWAKKLKRGEVLDNAVFVRAEKLPYKEALRYKTKHGEIVVRIEGKIVKVIEATHTIIDFFNE